MSLGRVVKCTHKYAVPPAHAKSLDTHVRRAWWHGETYKESSHCVVPITGNIVYLLDCVARVAPERQFEVLRLRCHVCEPQNMWHRRENYRYYIKPRGGGWHEITECVEQDLRVSYRRKIARFQISYTFYGALKMSNRSEIMSRFACGDFLVYSAERVYLVVSSAHVFCAVDHFVGVIRSSIKCSPSGNVFVFMDAGRTWYVWHWSDAAGHWLHSNLKEAVSSVNWIIGDGSLMHVTWKDASKTAFLCPRTLSELFLYDMDAHTFSNSGRLSFHPTNPELGVLDGGRFDYYSVVVRLEESTVCFAPIFSKILHERDRVITRENDWLIMNIEYDTIICAPYTWTEAYASYFRPHWKRTIIERAKLDNDSSCIVLSFLTAFVEPLHRHEDEAEYTESTSLFSL